MSLPTKNEKEYLEVTEANGTLALVGKKVHTDELAILFRQYGLRCHRDVDVRPDEDALRFAPGEDRAQIEKILNAYKNAKGS